MSEFQHHPYEWLNPKQREIAPEIEALLIGLTVAEAKELLHKVGKKIEETKLV